MDLRDLYIVEITDSYVRENFRKIKDFTNDTFRLKNLKMFEITIRSNASNIKFKHNLGFTPKDVIQTSLVVKTSSGIPSTATLTWNYGYFDSNFIDITTASIPASGTLVVRALIGSLDGDV